MLHKQSNAENIWHRFWIEKAKESMVGQKFDV